MGTVKQSPMTQLPARAGRTSPRPVARTEGLVARPHFARGNGAMARLFRAAKDDEPCPKCAAKLHRKAGPGRDPEEVPPIVYEVLRSPGRPLDEGVRADMERRFGGADFSEVRIHTDGRAAQSAEAVNAQAYSVGNHIAFANGRY